MGHVDSASLRLPGHSTSETFATIEEHLGAGCDQAMRTGISDLIEAATDTPDDGVHATLSDQTLIVSRRDWEALGQSRRTVIAALLQCSVDATSVTIGGEPAQRRYETTSSSSA